MDTIRKHLHNAQQGYAALLEVWKEAKAHLMAGRRLVLVLQPETRTLSLNAHFHSLIHQIAAQVGGPLADPDDAKRILISAFKMDTINDVDLRSDWAKFGDFRVGRGLRGEAVLLGTQSRDFTVKLATAFVDWLNAFGSEHGVKFKAWEGEHA